ncbi:MAG: YkgJ family cysteine cluster protein [Gammaproteobacteria bacterium]|nr:YkgJ family cysteine cluster protein [Gammaproteobacteria bacterium]NIR98067.1 YkgJ family cysteine cluster protein [Gammaproteobacteria bacterium]NIT63777.1 YkgJ family cysteine cluster protein [Gammaproteobacteria bacterium]NIV20727.1 YkgJ family cysteine cluster protein [Gammaproteobacteria bacterium]NIY32357.1 YkgJ family cysteine cluster protein [Gammaproteobacteria bacterium]
MYYRFVALRFRCSGCGRCCHGDDDSFIAVSGEEAERIRRYLGLSAAWFRRRYLVPLDGGERGLRIDAGGRCALLGRDGRCRIYPVRPTQCRTYPFWPENVASRSAWLREARRCEGIGRGPHYPRRYVEAQLRRLEEDDG